MFIYPGWRNKNICLWILSWQGQSDFQFMSMVGKKELLEFSILIWIYGLLDYSYLNNQAMSLFCNVTKTFQACDIYSSLLPSQLYQVIYMIFDPSLIFISLLLFVSQGSSRGFISQKVRGWFCLFHLHLGTLG